MAREFMSELTGRPHRPQPSPGPWTVREHKGRDHFAGQGIRNGGREPSVWIVLDANGKCVAECDKQIDAIHIAENGPRPPEGR